MMRAKTDAGLSQELSDCIAIPSPTPPGDAADVATWVEDWICEMGGRATRDTVWEGADNLLGTLQFGDGPRLVLNTHMDVVDPSTQEWTSDPYRAVERDGKLYGRGAVDAKGSLVAMLAAMERVARSPGSLCGEVMLTAVVGEEAGGLGSRHLVSRGFDADAAIVGEPTELDVAYAHKGTYMRELVFRGRAAHSASPWLGRSALADAAAFVAESERETSRLATSPHPALGPATFTVTKLHSGDLQNTVPEEAIVLVDRRMLPGETHSACDQELSEALQRIERVRPGSRVSEFRTVVATVPSETTPSHPVVQAALAAVRDVCGGDPKPAGFNAGCDMSKLTAAGIPTVICGPGSLGQAHRPDEHVPIKQVTDAARIYERIIRSILDPDVGYTATQRRSYSGDGREAKGGH